MVRHGVFRITRLALYSEVKVSDNFGMHGV